MARIFISYSRTDEAFGRQLATSLSGLGADVWIDIEDIPVGMKWSRAIQEGLDVSDVLLVVISPESMASNNVEDEWQYYLDQKKPVIPLLYMPAKLHFQLSRMQYIDFKRNNYDRALRQLHAELGRKGVQLNPLPKRSTLTQPIARVAAATSAPQLGRKFPLTWLVAGGIVLVIGVGLGLFLSNPARLTERPGAPTATTDRSEAVFVTATADESKSVEIVSDLPSYNSGSISFDYPQGWVADSITDEGDHVIFVGSSQDVIDAWTSEGFSLDNAVESGEIGVTIIPYIEDSLAGSYPNAAAVVQDLQYALVSSAYFGFSDIMAYDSSLGDAAYVTGSGDSYSVEIKVIDTGDEAGYVLLFGAAAHDRASDLAAAILMIADSLEV